MPYILIYKVVMWTNRPKELKKISICNNLASWNRRELLVLDTLSKFERDPKSYGYDFANIMKVVGTQLKSFDALWIVKKIFDTAELTKLKQKYENINLLLNIFKSLGGKYCSPKYPLLGRRMKAALSKNLRFQSNWSA